MSNTLGPGDTASHDLSRRVPLELSIGHLLVAWDILANKLCAADFADTLSEEEQHAIWALQDLCENCLAQNGVTGLPEPAWNALMRAATEHVRGIDVEFRGPLSCKNASHPHASPSEEACPSPPSASKPSAST